MKTLLYAAALALSLCSPTCTAVVAAPAGLVDYESRTVEGWTLLIRKDLLETEPQLTDRAIELLKIQLQEVLRVVPKTAVTELQKVRLYFCPEYPGIGPRAEYHPSGGWLKSNGRDPEMAKGIEFTNISIFEQEVSRMPNFALHELAHAMHDRVLRLGFDNPEIREAFERAKASGSYDKVERRFGKGRENAFEKAYAMTTPQEYFAESTEACFSTNDFFPFNREQLKQHDPEMLILVQTLWGITPDAAQ
jgi:hypothetical protein